MAVILFYLKVISTTVSLKLFLYVRRDLWSYYIMVHFVRLSVCPSGRPVLAKQCPLINLFHLGKPFLVPWMAMAQRFLLILRSKVKVTVTIFLSAQ